MTSTLAKRKAFLAQIISEDFACYIFKSISNYNKFIIVEFDHTNIFDDDWSKIILRKAITVYDSFNHNRSVIHFYEEENQIKFDYLNDEQYLDDAIADIEINSSLKLLDSKCYLYHFNKLKKSIHDYNKTWETIDYYGLLIRHKHYYCRWSDFGTANYMVTVLGNPLYISPYQKKPLEFDYFDDGGWTRFRHWVPKELFSDVTLDNYSGGSFESLLLAKSFHYFFDNKQFLITNYDEHFKYDSRFRIMPDEFKNISFPLSVNSIDSYY